MSQRRCYTNLWFLPFAAFVILFIGSIAVPVNGDESLGKVKQGELELRLASMTNEELNALVKEDSVPATIRDLRVSPDQLKNALIKELAKRLPTPNTPMAGTTNVKKVATAVSKADVGVEVEDQTSVEPTPVGPTETKLANVGVECFSGAPFAVGMIELQYEPGHGPVIYPDQPLFLDSTDQRAHYIAFELSYQQDGSEPTMMVDRLRARFLLRDSDSCQMSLSTVTGTLLEKTEVQPIQDRGQYREKLDQWWKQFSVIPTSYGPEQRELKGSLLDMLARRLQLPGPWPPIANIDDRANETSLEHQFERGIGMLFGIESVKLAMRADSALSQSGRFEKADQTVPARPVLRSVVIPQAPQATWIEPIAMRVPAECFYLRTGSLANYRQFRAFLVGWGGSLYDIVSTGAVDHQSRERIEGQLGLSIDQVETGRFDALIDDMALIGCDPMFDDGASVGILFQASDSIRLASVLKAQRNQARLRVPESAEDRVIVDGHAVSFLTSEDQRLRSFYAIDGNFHLVTNSYQLLTRFFEASKGTESLGGLNEFRYARNQTNQLRQQNQQQPLAMLYLSDPFFQNLVSPQYRIEMTRRRQAAQELKQYQLAVLIAKAEQIDAVTTDQLIESKLLPLGFGSRPDGSYPIFEKGILRDSMRGALGYFLPIPDVPLQKATQTEIRSYSQFMQQYNQEWRRVDPVTVVFSRDKSDKDGLQQVSLDVVITPYARQRYALLSQHLAPANDQRVAPMNDDLVSLDTSIRDAQGSRIPHLLYLGLRDDDVPYVIENGQIKLEKRHKRSTYAKSNSYAAISPPSTNVLKLLASTFSRVQRPQDAQAVPTKHPRPVPPRVGNTPGVSLFSLFMSYAVLRSSDVFKYASSISSNDKWVVASTNYSLRKDVLDKISEENIRSCSQVRLRVKPLADSKVEPYIQAHTYLASRKASFENARFLNDVTHWLQLPITESRDMAETVLGVHLRCPLGGDFELSDLNDHRYWKGTKWPKESYFAETETPPAWKFAFLDWLRGLDLQFDIDQTTLRAHIDMLVQPPDGKNADKGWASLRLQGPRNPGNAGLVEKTPVVVQTNFQSTTNWVLGVRVESAKGPFRIKTVHPNSPASGAGLSVGDQILAVDRVKPESVKHVIELIQLARDEMRPVSLRLLRNGSLFELQVSLRTR